MECAGLNDSAFVCAVSIIELNAVVLAVYVYFEASWPRCEYAIYVKALIKRQEGQATAGSHYIT